MMGHWQMHGAEWTMPDTTQRIRARRLRRLGAGFQACLISVLLVALACCRTLADEPAVTPASMARIGEVDERFQSYNVEMVEVTGVRMCKRYAPPAGFSGVLTRQQWRGVIDFSQAVRAPIVTSFAVSPGPRDAAGVWTPNQA